MLNILRAFRKKNVGATQYCTFSYDARLWREREWPEARRHLQKRIQWHSGTVGG